MGYSGGNMDTLGTVTLNGGTLSTYNGFNAANESYYIKGGTVSVGGSAPSVINTIGTTYTGIQLAGSTTFNVAATGGTGPDLTVSVPLLDRPSNDSGAALLTKTGAGFMALTGACTYTGGTTVSGGTLAIAGSGSLGSSGNYSLAIANSGALVFNTTTAQTLSGAISGTGSLAQMAASTLILSGANTYSGPTTIGGGTLQIGSSGYLGSGGTYNAAIANSGSLVLNTSTNQTLSGSISGTGGLTLAAASGTVTLAGVNSYTGGTTVNGQSGDSYAGVTNLYLNSSGGTAINGNLTIGGSVRRRGQVLGPQPVRPQLRPHLHSDRRQRYHGPGLLHPHRQQPDRGRPAIHRHAAEARTSRTPRSLHPPAVRC